MKERKKAAALQYSEDLYAPKVVAKGMGLIADKIIEEANKEEVPVVYNKEMADLLNNVDVGDYIPSELYEAVAHIIAYIVDVDKGVK